MHERERGGTQSDYWRMREVVEEGGGKWKWWREVVEGGGREVVEVGEWKWWREVGEEVLVPLSASLQRRKVARDDGNELEHSK